MSFQSSGTNDCEYEIVEKYAPIGISEKIRDEVENFMKPRIYPAWLRGENK